jgi:hypothetical protein
VSTFRSLITSSSMFLALLVSAATARAQVHVRVGDQRSSLVVSPSTIEAAIYLELYGHPDTARRHIEVRVRHDRLELTGAVANEPERLTALRIAADVAPDLKVDDRMEVKADGPFPRTEIAGDGTPAELRRRFTDVLAGKFPPEILRELTLTAYRVALPASVKSGGLPSKQRVSEGTGWVLVLEGVVPSTDDQVAMSELLLFESPGAAAVINRTFVADGYVPEYKPKVHVRVPFVHVDVGNTNGVDVHVGPLLVRTGGGYRAADDPALLDEYMNAVRADAELHNAPLRAHVLGGVLTIEGTLKAADKMRAVAMATRLRSIRGVVDRSGVFEDNPAYYSKDDLIAYLGQRLGEHAGARNVELTSDARHRLNLRATVPTHFHADLALAVIANDPALSRLPVEPVFREAVSGAVLSTRR